MDVKFLNFGTFPNSFYGFSSLHLSRDSNMDKVHTIFFALHSRKSCKNSG